MAFPITSTADGVVELFIDGAWVDITADVRHDAGIDINRGRRDEQSRVGFTRCNLTINNRDGKYSQRNPSSIYFGKIGRNTELRVRVEDFATTPSLRGTVTTASSGDATYAVAPPTGVVAGDVLIAFQSADAAVLADLAEPTGNPSVDAPWELLDSAYTDASNDLATKIWWRIARDDEPLSYNFFQTASSDGICTIAAIKDAGHATPLVDQTLETNPGTSVDTPALTPATNNDFELRWVAMTDASGAANTWTPPAGLTERSDLQSTTFTTGSLATRPLTDGQATGVATFTASSAVFDSAHGFTVHVMPDEVRSSGEVSQWPQRWDATGTDVYVPIEACGILRRLGQGASPLRSALFRELSENTDLVGYWSLEDGGTATQFASGIGGLPARVIGSVEPATGTQTGAGTAPLAVPAGNAIIACGLPTRTATAWSVGALFYFTTEPNDAQPFLTVTALGSLTLWNVSYAPLTNELLLAAFDSDSVAQIDVALVLASSIAQRWVYVQLSATQNGTAIDYTVGIDESPTSGEALVSSEPTQTLGAVIWVDCKGGDVDGTSIGHVYVADSDLPFSSVGVPAMLGYTGETAVERITRLCEEEGIALDVIGEAADTETVGVQRVATLLDLLNDAADADQGILYEPRDRLGLTYRTKRSLYNQTAALELDYSLTHLSGSFEPVDDDQSIRNDVTVKRLDGSEARAVLDTGPLSVLSPPDGVGRYDEAVTLVVETDEQLEQIATWRRHLGTWDEARYPSVSVNLARSVFTASSALTLAAVGVDVGDYLTVDNPPAWLPPDLIELLAQGFNERLSTFQWSIGWNATPAGPYQVMGVYDTSRYDTDGSTLATGNTSANAQGTPLNLTYVIVSDADAANFPVGADIMIYDANGTPKFSTVHNVDSKASAGGFTNLTVTPSFARLITAADADVMRRVDETSLSVARTNSTSPLWTTSVGAGFDIGIGGERMTVTAISGASSPQTFTVTRSVNGVQKAHSSGAAVGLWRPARYAL